MPNPRGIPLKNIHPENLDPRSNVRTSLRNTRRRHMANYAFRILLDVAIIRATI